MLSEVRNLRFLVPGRLAFLAASDTEVDACRQSFGGEEVCFFSSNLHKQYVPFANDFGPVNLAVVHRFCQALAPRMESRDSKTWVYCFEDGYREVANASFLLGAFLVMHFDYTPEQATSPFLSEDCPFSVQPFRDITLSRFSPTLSLLDALSSLAKAKALGWFHLATFDASAYRELDSPAGGDVHEVCPRFVAFKGPLAADSPYRQPGEVALTPEAYVPILRRLGVECVVRLNEEDSYDAGVFERAGMAHVDLWFPDCTAPPEHVAGRFLDLCRARHGRIAVHCRAGLGRTGTLIALWMMREHGLAAGEAVGWLRAVRPGSVMGCQHAFLLSHAPRAAGPSRRLLPRSRATAAFATSCRGQAPLGPLAADGDLPDGAGGAGSEAAQGCAAGGCAEVAGETAAQVIAGACSRGLRRASAARHEA